MKYKVWDCKIVVPGDSKLPPGFDSPPRCAAEEAVLAAGVPVLACFSGWAGELTELEEELVTKQKERTNARDDHRS